MVRNVKKSTHLNILLAFVAAIFLLCGCGGQSYSDLKPLPTTGMPLAPAAAALPEYKIQIGDELDFVFYTNPELNESVVVRPDGMVSTALVEKIQVYNRTPSQVNADLKELYKDELRKPRINTIVRAFAPVKVYVSGEVVAPGEFEAVGQTLTLTQVIAMAGGLKNSAQGETVLVYRRGLGEEGEVFVADYDSATQGGDPALDARLAPHDVVFVPKTGAALFYKTYEQAIGQYVNPSLGAGAFYDIRD